MKKRVEGHTKEANKSQHYVHLNKIYASSRLPPYSGRLVQILHMLSYIPNIECVQHIYIERVYIYNTIVPLRRSNLCFARQDTVLEKTKGGYVSYTPVCLIYYLQYCLMRVYFVGIYISYICIYIYIHTYI